MNKVLLIPKEQIIIDSDTYSNRNDIIEIQFEQPSSLIKIKDRAFANCINLKRVIDIPSEVKVLENGSFLGCKNLNEVSFALRKEKDTLSFEDNKSYTNPFWGCESLERIELKCSLNDIMSDVFTCKFKQLKSNDGKRIIDVFFKVDEEIKLSKLQQIKSSELSQKLIDNLSESINRPISMLTNIISSDGFHNSNYQLLTSFNPMNIILTVLLVLSYRRSYILKYSCKHNRKRNYND